jgi:hypothetical protein
MTAAAHVRQLASGDFVVHALDDHLLSVARLAGVSGALAWQSFPVF